MATEPGKPSAHRWARLVLPAVHVLLCVAAQMGVFGTEGSWRWFPVFFVDFPLSIVLIPAVNAAPPLLVFGVVGTVWWYLINWFLVYCAHRLSVRPRAQ